MTMKTEDVTVAPQLALDASGIEETKVANRPRLLSDNGSSYIAGDLADWLTDKEMGHVRGARNHPQTQGKIERWYQTLKNVRRAIAMRLPIRLTLLENYFLQEDLEAAVDEFVGYYNHRRYHESLKNLTSADVYFWAWTNDSIGTEENQKEGIRKTALAAAA